MKSWADHSSDEDETPPAVTTGPDTPTNKDPHQSNDYPPPPPIPSKESLPEMSSFTAHLRNLSYDIARPQQLVQELQHLVETRYQGNETLTIKDVKMEQKGTAIVEVASLEELLALWNLNDGYSVVCGRTLRIDVGDKSLHSRGRRDNDRDAGRRRGQDDIDGSQWRGGRYAQKDSDGNAGRDSDRQQFRGDRNGRDNDRDAGRRRGQDDSRYGRRDNDRDAGRRRGQDDIDGSQFRGGRYMKRGDSDGNAGRDTDRHGGRYGRDNDGDNDRRRRQDNSDRPQFRGDRHGKDNDGDAGRRRGQDTIDGSQFRGGRYAQKDSDGEAGKQKGQDTIDGGKKKGQDTIDGSQWRGGRYAQKDSDGEAGKEKGQARQTRNVLQLQPRSKSIEEPAVNNTSQSTIFGGATPRKEQLDHKNVSIMRKPKDTVGRSNGKERRRPSKGSKQVAKDKQQDSGDKSGKQQGSGDTSSLQQASSDKSGKQQGSGEKSGKSKRRPNKNPKQVSKEKQKGTSADADKSGSPTNVTPPTHKKQPVKDTQEPEAKNKLLPQTGKTNTFAAFGGDSDSD